MMRRLAARLVLPALLLTGCALSGAPAWVKRGHLDCSLSPCPDVYSAAGHSTGVRNPSLRHAAAEANARAELAKVVAKKLHRAPSDPFRSVVLESTVGVEIVDRWIAKNGDEYALATLSAESYRHALDAQPTLSPPDREALEKQAAALFGK